MCNRWLLVQKAEMAACCLLKSHHSLQLHTNQHFMLTEPLPHIQNPNTTQAKAMRKKKVLSVGVGRFSHLGLAAGDMKYKDAPRYPQLLDPPIFSAIHFSAAMHASLDQSSLTETRKKRKKVQALVLFPLRLREKKKKVWQTQHQAPFFPVILRIIAPSFVSEVSRWRQASCLRTYQLTRIESLKSPF